MFSPKQLLVTCTTLLCLEHRDGINTSASNGLIEEVLAALPLPEFTVDQEQGRQTFLELRAAVVWLNSRGTDNFPSDQEVLQNVQMACREETYLFEAIMNPLMEIYATPEEVIRLIRGLRERLHKYLTDERICSLMKNINHRLMFKRGAVDVLDEIRDLTEQLEPLIQARSKAQHPSMMASTDFSDQASLAKYFDEVKVTMSAEGALQTGWKGLNRLLGKVGAFKRGEFATVGALQHNFKSGFMLSMFVFAALFNKPVLRDKTKKPLLYFVTLENEVSDNLLWIYRYIKENETGVPVIDSQIDTEEAVAFVADRLRAGGFEVKMDRFDPTEFSCASFVGILDGLVSDGYEIVGLYVDYLNMISKAGIEAKVAGDDIRMAFRRIRNYCAPRGIFFMSPHQLSSDALQLTRENVDDFVKKVANKGYYDGCRRLGQEPDLELFLHIVKVNGRSYLTIQRGKHRNVVTAEKDQYIVLPYSDVGTICWDVDKEYEITCAIPGGGAIGSEEETPWWVEA